jgi:ATP-dependent DNA ligase
VRISFPLSGRRRRLNRLLKRAKVPCLYLVEAFDDGQALLEAAERHGLEGVVSKWRSAHYRSGVDRRSTQGLGGKATGGGGLEHRVCR